MAPKKGADDPNAPRNHPCSKALKEQRDALNQGIHVKAALSITMSHAEGGHEILNNDNGTLD